MCSSVFVYRMVVPGHAGVRNVKWVGKVLLSSQEAPGTWQMGMAYKVHMTVVYLFMLSFYLVHAYVYPMLCLRSVWSSC